MNNLFDLTGKTALITGAAGLLGPKHAEAIIEQNGNVIISDRDFEKAKQVAGLLNEKYECMKALPAYMDVTDKASIDEVMNAHQRIDILINNAAKDPKVTKGESLTPETRFEVMTEEYWKEGLDAIINGTFLCSQAAANKMLSLKGGVILNISSDLGVIAPDQRLYRQEGVPENQQNVKPITYSAAKWAVIGMTKYLATYYASRNIRVNALSPSGVYNDHPEEFAKKLSSIIPMGRMSHIDEYKGAIMFLCSDASSYMTGENMIIDGGKTVW
jgi:NAD(P)-dependent dehydrogenase (short-subunit alcohol dehydrogenase family)